MTFDLEQLAAAATAACDAPVRDLEPIRVQPTGAVYRAVLDDAEQRSVIVKRMRDGESWVRERAFLELAREHRLPGVAQLIGVSDEQPLAVLEDLGAEPSLADRLLGNDPGAATAALLRWVDAAAGLQVASRELGAQFAERMSQLAPAADHATDATTRYADDLIAKIAVPLDRVGIPLTHPAADELRRAVASLSGEDRPAGLVPGDTCPDNNVDGTNGLTLFDFEGAQFRHVAWEMAYVTTPWPTCWCSWDIPAQVQKLALERWRSVLESAFPQVRQPGFDRDLARARTVWAAQWTAYTFEGALEEREHPRFDEGVVPARRASLQFRLSVLAENTTEECPELAAFATSLLAWTHSEWGALHLDVAPAWR